MSLSRAVRSGSELHSQAPPHVFFKYDPKDRDRVLGSSALGAAWAALGLRPQDLLTVELHRRFPVLSRRLGSCPADADCGDWRTLEVQITHLEDVHSWTRDRIAHWLEARGL